MESHHQMNAMARELQPDIIINNRSGLPEKAPNALATKCDRKPSQMLGAGCMIIDDDPWRKPKK